MPRGSQNCSGPCPRSPPQVVSNESGGPGIELRRGGDLVGLLADLPARVDGADDVVVARPALHVLVEVRTRALVSSISEYDPPGVRLRESR